MCTGPGSGQGQSPRIFNRLRDFEATYRAVPVSLYLGVLAFALKGVGEGFEAPSERLGALREARVENGGFGGALIDQLVGQQQRSEQQLARFRHGAEAGEGLA